jgi:RNA polymerase sigma-70 factor (ECF subfamily)
MTDAGTGTTTERREDRWRQAVDQVRAFVAGRVGDPELAADITQDVMVRSIASGALERVDNPTAWLYRSARNAVIDHYRTRRVNDPAVELEGWPDPEPPDNRPNPATRALARCLQPLLGELPPSSRDAITRVDLDGQTHAQAAAQLGISVSGMKSRVQRARRHLKDLLTGCCQVDVDRAGAVSGYRANAAPCGCGSGAVNAP